MNLGDVLFFDTETTGIPDNKWKWDLDYQLYPHLVQLSWIGGCKQEDHIIRPEGWKIPKEAEEIHGISTGLAKIKGEPFKEVITKFIDDCSEFPLICGHNIHFDTSIVKANILRELGWDWYDSHKVEEALHKGKRLDTMRASMKFVDARFANGRLKFPRLEELYGRCFNGETFPAHNALEDVKAVIKCMPILLDEGLIELKVKEYKEEKPNLFEKSTRKPLESILSDSIPKVDKSLVSLEKVPENEKEEKLTVDLLSDVEF